MKYFVIHSGRDLQQVQEMMSQWSDKYENIQFIVLNGSQENWEGDAIARIRECGKVLYIVGKTSADSPYIQRELNIANDEDKDIYVYKLEESYRINECLTKSMKRGNAFVGEYEGEIIIKKARDRVYLLDEEALHDRMREDGSELERMLRGKSFEDKQTLLEQYKMFVQTSEDLVRRKQSVNSFYVTLTSLVLGAIVSIFCASKDLSQNIAGDNLMFYATIGLSMVGLVICGSWISLLRSYSDLNSDKIKIIGAIEAYLPLKLYETEWVMMARSLGNKKYRSFTRKEIVVAGIFCAMFAVVLALSIVLCLRA